MRTEVIITAVVFAALLLLGAITNRIRRARRTKVVWAVGFPRTWLPYLERGLSIYPKLPLDLRERVQELAFFKINDLLFDGKGPYEDLPEDITVSIGAHIGLLHANIRIPPLPAVRTVVVAPLAELEQLDAVSREAFGPSVLLTWWDPEAKAARMFREERDPELLTHWEQLAPKNDGAMFFAGWARSLHTDSARGRARAAEVMPELGSDSALFAAASEAFIRYPEHLLKHDPTIYSGLRAFYRLDPARWGR